MRCTSRESHAQHVARMTYGISYDSLVGASSSLLSPQLLALNHAVYCFIPNTIQLKPKPFHRASSIVSTLDTALPKLSKRSCQPSSRSHQL